MSIDNSKNVSNNSKNNKKLAKSIKLNFAKAIRKAKIPSFLNSNTRQAFT